MAARAWYGHSNFFLWEITQKFFFLAWGIHILAIRKKYCCQPGGSQLSPGVILAHFRVKKGYFRANFHKKQSFLAFKDFFLTSRASKHRKYSNNYLLRKILPKMSKNGIQKLQKWQFLSPGTDFYDSRFKIAITRNKMSILITL